MDVLVRRNRIQCICALISCAIVVICVCIGVTMNLTTLYDEDFDNMGIYGYHRLDNALTDDNSDKVSLSA